MYQNYGEEKSIPIKIMSSLVDVSEETVASIIRVAS
jgi:hypothetical protein